MEYVSPSEVINGDGLRLVLLQYMPSPWGQAAKAMMEYKGLSYTAAPWEGGGANEELVAWTGNNNGAPIVAWNDEAPITRWDDILFLLERLAPEKPLIPDSRRDRMRVLGLSHEICGPLGLAWNRRLSMFAPMLASGQAPEGFVLMAKKYGSTEEDVVRADERQIATLKVLAGILKAQESAGSGFFIGESVTAVDFYWAAFSNLFDLLPPEKCPMPEQGRPMFTTMADDLRAAVDPILIEHRDRIMAAHFKIPMEM
jgi:glutathione S-transferase